MVYFFLFYDAKYKMVEIWPLLCEGVGHWGRSERLSARAVANLTAAGGGGHGTVCRVQRPDLWGQEGRC